MSKYMCTACKGESDHAKVCETEGCSKEGEPLTKVKNSEETEEEEEDEDEEADE